MRSITSILCILCLCFITRAQDVDPKPPQSAPSPETSKQGREILEKAQDALKQVKTVRYRMKYQAAGWVTKYASNVEGTVFVGELSELNIPRFRCEIKITPPDAKEPVELQAGSDGDLYYVIDPKAKIVYADIDEAVLGSRSQDVLRVPLRQFIVTEPLAGELRSNKIELKDEEVVGGVDCHRIEITMTPTHRIVWFIAKKDHLPRRLVRVYTDATLGDGSVVYEIHDLEAMTTCDAKDFELKVPDGYKKTDDFAP